MATIPIESILESTPKSVLKNWFGGVFGNLSIAYWEAYGQAGWNYSIDRTWEYL